MLKPALARGELHCIGATTLDEYRNYIEKDSALARRFQPVYVDEPTVEDTVFVLRGLKEKYELHHGVHIADDAIIAASRLSNRYINERFLPDKAIDVMDEAASHLRIKSDSKPEELDKIDRQIIQLKIEQAALNKEDHHRKEKRLATIADDLTMLEAQSQELTASWQAINAQRGEVTRLQQDIEDARYNLAVAQRQGELDRAAELTYATLPALEQELAAAKDAVASSPMVDEVIDAHHIAEVISSWTGIPVDKMMNGEQDRLLDMENVLARNVVGAPGRLRRSPMLSAGRAGSAIEPAHGQLPDAGANRCRETELARPWRHSS